MPKIAQKAEFKSFVKGLITEASELNFPENTSQEEENFVLDRKGTRSRRLGMDVETGAVFVPTNVSTASLFNVTPTLFKWDSVGGDAKVNFIVVQVGNVINFHNPNTDAISTDIVGTLKLWSFSSDEPFSFASVNGNLVVAANHNRIAIITWLPKSSTFTLEYDNIKVRDLWGVATTEVGYTTYESDDTYRGGLPNSHLYNLQNQSWGIPRKDKTGTLSDPVKIYLTALGVAPSNSELVWPGLQHQPVESGADPYERIYPNLYTEVLGAGAKAAKGYFIIDALQRGVSRESAYTANRGKFPQLYQSEFPFKADYTEGGVTEVAEFAGRVFFSGFTGKTVDGDARSPNLASYVFFSQLVKSDVEITKCYQSGDPTSRSEGDVVDTDGGFISISGAMNIRRLIVIGNSLIVLADNGVWSITGGSEYGFTATNYRVDHLSSFGIIAPNSAVSDGSQVAFWSKTGIYIVAPGDRGLSVSNITETTIQSYYQKIDNGDKQKAWGSYDEVGKKLRWLYTEGEMFNEAVTKELVLDMVLGAFYVNRIYNTANDDICVVASFTPTSFKYVPYMHQIVSSREDVVANGVSVGLLSQKPASPIQRVRYLAVKLVEGLLYYTFASYQDALFRDWPSIISGGKDAKAYMVTGDMTAGDTAAEKQLRYLITHLRRTTSSSCIASTQWDWTNSSVSNRWSRPQQLYRYRQASFSDNGVFDTGYKLVTSKSVLRGRGKAFALRFETEPLKDCQIVGWALSIDGNGYV